jgi:hypothetical protein
VSGRLSLPCDLLYYQESMGPCLLPLWRHVSGPFVVCVRRFVCASMAAVIPWSASGLHIDPYNEECPNKYANPMSCWYPPQLNTVLLLVVQLVVSFQVPHGPLTIYSPACQFAGVSSHSIACNAYHTAVCMVLCAVMSWWQLISQL